MNRCLSFRWVLLSCLLAAGCTAWPRATHPPRLHNPFPQLQRVAVLPFFNQSEEPTVDGLKVAEAYQTELQKIRGFQVMPVGVVDQYLRDSRTVLDETTDFQQLAGDLGVDVLVVGSVTDFDPYTPPRMGLAVDWYAANPGFHPIPAGYGLPWGTPEEEYLPENLVWEAEFELAKRQLETQTPVETGGSQERRPGIPADWPDAKGFTPAGPESSPPAVREHRGPLMELVRQYDAADSETLALLRTHHLWQEEIRPGGWRGKLIRSDDYIRFCCHLHIAELLAARGGVDQSSVAIRLPGSR